MRAHEARRTVKRLHFLRGLLRAKLRQPRASSLNAAELFGARDPLVAPAWRLLGDEPAKAVRERLECTTRSRQPLAISLLGHFAECRSIAVRQVEHLSKHVRETMLAIEAGEHC